METCKRKESHDILDKATGGQDQYPKAINSCFSGRLNINILSSLSVQYGTVLVVEIPS